MEIILQLEPFFSINDGLFMISLLNIFRAVPVGIGCGMSLNVY